MVATHKRRCAAMKKAGIADPESTEGMQFCAGVLGGAPSQCPYDRCVVFEYAETAAQMKVSERRELARDLHAHKVSVADIALIVRKSIREVQRYIRS